MRCEFSWLSRPVRGTPLPAGGDIVCWAEESSAIQLLIGDVMGHGLRAARTSAEVAGAFGELARMNCPLEDLVLRLDAFLTARERGAWDEFVTALIISIPRDPGAQAEIVSCGHPLPLLLHGLPPGRVATPVDLPVGLPLGLLDLADCPARPIPLQVAPGDSLLLYTDGVTDARDALGRSFPLAERAVALAETTAALAGGGALPGDGARLPAEGSAALAAGTGLLHAIQADLIRHADGALADDATMLLIDFLAVQGRPLAPAVPAVPVDSLLSEAADWGGSILG
jgi:hypothetical protein